MLHVLGPQNVPANLWDEDALLDAVGARMGELLTSMQPQEAQRAVMLSLSKEQTLRSILYIGDQRQ